MALQKLDNLTQLHRGVTPQTIRADENYIRNIF